MIKGLPNVRKNKIKATSKKVKKEGGNLFRSWKFEKAFFQDSDENPSILEMIKGRPNENIRKEKLPSP